MLSTPGVDGKDVLAEMEQHYAETKRTHRNEQDDSSKANPCTLRNNVSKVWRAFLNQDKKTLERGRRVRHRSYISGAAAMKRAAKGASAECRKAVDAFLAMPLSEQLEHTRRHARRDGTRASVCNAFSESDAVNDAFRKLRLLPEEAARFKIEREVSRQCDERIKQRLLEKPTIEVASLSATVTELHRILLHAEMVSREALICALLCVCGRRFTELLNGRSTFEPHPLSEFACIFSGQLKTRKDVDDGPTYAIPLLIEFRTFERAVKALRRRVGPTASLTNAQVSARFQPGTSRFLHGRSSGDVEGGPFAQLPITRPHDFRAFWTAACVVVFALHKQGWRLRRVVRYVLGHADTSTSESYDHVIIEPEDESSFTALFGTPFPKKFPLTEEDLRLAES